MKPMPDDNVRNVWVGQLCCVTSTCLKLILQNTWKTNTVAAVRSNLRNSSLQAACNNSISTLYLYCILCPMAECCWFIESSRFLWSSLKTRFQSWCTPWQYCGIYGFRRACILGHYGHTRSQAGRQQAAAKPTLYTGIKHKIVTCTRFVY